MCNITFSNVLTLVALQQGLLCLFAWKSVYPRFLFTLGYIMYQHSLVNRGALSDNPLRVAARPTDTVSTTQVYSALRVLLFVY